MDDEHSEIRIVASQEEHKQITTNPDELLEEKLNHKEQEEPKNAKAKASSLFKVFYSPSLNFFLLPNLF